MPQSLRKVSHDIKLGLPCPCLQIVPGNIGCGPARGKFKHNRGWFFSWCGVDKPKVDPEGERKGKRIHQGHQPSLEKTTYVDGWSSEKAQKQNGGGRSSEKQNYWWC